jgi:hypothetical protein
MAAQFREEFETTIDVTSLTIEATATMVAGWVKERGPNKPSPPYQ